MSLLQMTGLECKPNNEELIKDDDWLKDPETKKDVLYCVASSIVSKFVRLNLDNDTFPDDNQEDKNLEYSKLLLSVGLRVWQWNKSPLMLAVPSTHFKSTLSKRLTYLRSITFFIKKSSTSAYMESTCQCQWLSWSQHSM